MPRVLSTAFLLALVSATTLAFVVTEGLKLQPSPIRSVYVDKVFSPTCDCDTDQASIRFRLRKADRMTLSIVDADAKEVVVLVGPQPTKKGIVTAVWDGRDGAGTVVPDGAYRPRVHLERAHRTIVLPNPISVDTRAPVVTLLGVSPRVFRPRERLTVRYRVSEPAQASVDVDGKRVVRGKSAKLVWRLNWYGVARGRAYPPGTYRVAVVARDTAGNLSLPSRSARITIPLAVEAKRVRVSVGGTVRVRLSTDGRAYHWRLAARSGIARVRALRVPAPARPGRYTLVIRQDGLAHRVAVVVGKR